jgi:hypothetical protein
MLTAGRHEALFTADATTRIYLLTSGVPRSIVIICLNLCLDAHQRGVGLIDGALVEDWTQREGERFREQIFAMSR